MHHPCVQWGCKPATSQCSLLVTRRYQLLCAVSGIPAASIGSSGKGWPGVVWDFVGWPSCYLLMVATTLQLPHFCTPFLPPSPGLALQWALGIQARTCFCPFYPLGCPVRAAAQLLHYISWGWAGARLPATGVCPFLFRHPCCFWYAYVSMHVSLRRVCVLSKRFFVELWLPDL